MDARAQIREFAEQIKKLKPQLVDEVLKGNHILTICVTCGKTFVDMPFKEFILKDSKNTYTNPGKWYWDAGIHYYQNPSHKIIGYSSHNPAYNFSNAFLIASVRFSNPNFSTKDILKEFIKGRKKAEGKPI